MYVTGSFHVTLAVCIRVQGYEYLPASEAGRFSLWHLLSGERLLGQN